MSIIVQSYQEDKRIELNKMYNTFHRFEQFYKISMEYSSKWSLEEFNCFWSWYYHSNISAIQALERTQI